MLNRNGFGLSRRGFLILAGAVLGAGVMPALSAADDPTTLFNQIRRAHGLGPVATDVRLEEAALYQARRMASFDEIGHSVGWGNGFVARLRKAGIHGPAAENVAAGQPDTRSVFDAWMKSPGHRRNMLDPEFSHYGLAWATPENRPNYIYWAMVLGR